MYASQTKRLCVRGAQSDETRVQHHSASEVTAEAGILPQQPQQPTTTPQSQLQQVSQSHHQLSSIQAQASPNFQASSLSGDGAGQSNSNSTTTTGLAGVVVVGGRCAITGSNNMTAPTTAGTTSNQTETSSFNNNTSSGTNNSTSITSHSTGSASSSSNQLLRQQQQHCSPANVTTATSATAVAAAAVVAAHQAQGQSAEHELINKLASETLEETRLELLLSIRNIVTACNKKKDSIVNNPNFTKIINLIDDDKPTSTVKTQLALLICSVAKSGEHNVKVLNESLIDDKIINLILNSQDESLTEACLRCMRSIMSWPKVSRTWLLYENQALVGPAKQDSNSNSNNGHSNGTNNCKDTTLGRVNLQKIINYARSSNSFIVQECVADIFANTCVRNKDQMLLYKASAIPCIIQLLESQSYRVILSALGWLMQMCLRNHLISFEVVKASCLSGTPVLDRLTHLMSKDKCYDLQFLSAKCFVHIYRALMTDVLKDDPRITNIVLPTLVRMVQKDKPAHLRIKSAECLAYLIECETKLQSTASVCDHLIDSLANMLEIEYNSVMLDWKAYNPVQFDCSRAQERGVTWLSIAHYSQQQSPILDLRQPQLDPSKGETDSGLAINQEMKRSAFLALAALASNLESIRKKIFNTCSVMQHLVKSLTDSDTKTLISVLTCLLSLSRSVQQLRTSFPESSVYTALKTLLNTTANEVLILVLAILCNISLDFSPGKQHFLDTKTIDMLCGLTRRSDPALKLHGMWILMNMVYHLKDQNLKLQILKSLGINHVLSLLESEDEEIVLKTLGFLRNLISQKHIDPIMSNHGEPIMQSLMRILEGPSSTRIKEQSLCVLTNIADGTESKTFIMNNKVVLAYLSKTMSDEQAGDLRLAAICCITNLAHKEYPGSHERRDEMKKFGIEDKLKAMLYTDNPLLSDRVRTAYNQFLAFTQAKPSYT